MPCAPRVWPARNASKRACDATRRRDHCRADANRRLSSRHQRPLPRTAGSAAPPRLVPSERATRRGACHGRHADVKEIADALPRLLAWSRAVFAELCGFVVRRLERGSAPPALRMEDSSAIVARVARRRGGFAGRARRVRVANADDAADAALRRGGDQRRARRTVSFDRRAARTRRPRAASAACSRPGRAITASTAACAAASTASRGRPRRSRCSTCCSPRPTRALGDDSRGAHGEQIAELLAREGFGGPDVFRCVIEDASLLQDLRAAGHRRRGLSLSGHLRVRVVDDAGRHRRARCSTRFRQQSAELAERRMAAGLERGGDGHARVGDREGDRPGRRAAR